jgi:cob(I)alamin adenosyltransferase
MSQKIYTKTGDAGKTGLLGGTRVSKSSLRIAAYGDLDELNSFIGLLIDQGPEEESGKILREIQDRLFTIGSSLAVDPEKELTMKIPDLRESDIHLLETTIDSMNAGLPVMKSFILPGGHPIVSLTHICRTVCRRAERAVVALDAQEKITQPFILPYLNRLSDYLFVLARHLGQKAGAAEIVWKPRV